MTWGRVPSGPEFAPPAEGYGATVYRGGGRASGTMAWWELAYSKGQAKRAGKILRDSVRHPLTIDEQVKPQLSAERATEVGQDVQGRVGGTRRRWPVRAWP